MMAVCESGQAALQRHGNISGGEIEHDKTERARA
jgi:hypothetical protein